MKTEADENYLKEIYNLELDHSHVTTSMLADRFGYSAATVTGMLKKLAGLKWVVYEPYQGVTLTDTGRAIALEVIRHHRLIETYLAQALDIPWDRVHEEAEKMEHVLSEYLEARIDELLGHPSFDPHGSPIPSLDGSIPEMDRLRLTALPEGALAEIVEVSDRDPKLLDRLGDLDLRPNTRIRVIEIEPLDGLIRVIEIEPLDGLISLQVGEEMHVLGPKTASQVIVRSLRGAEQ